MADELASTVEHLRMVQSVVSRMAANSAHMKTWAVSLVTAAFVFSGLSSDPHWLIGLGACIPVIAFWGMDAKYLHLERCYVKLYEAVADGLSVKPFDLDYNSQISSVDSVWKVAMSWSVCLFYGCLLTMTVALLAILAT